MELSFIIIGKNEDKNIGRCINSVYESISAAGITSYEIIYSDSGSTDNTIDIVKHYKEIKIVQITGPSNAAKGRNEGAKHATGNTLFFIDGDMELYPQFLVDELNHGTKDYEVVSGQWLDVTREDEWVRKVSKIFPGGTFLIAREAWEAVGGMRTRFNTGEECDLGMRLMKKGFRFKRKETFIVKHHTVSYMHSSRVWKRIKDKSIFYNRAIIYRHHLFNPQMWKLMWRADKTFIVMILGMLISFIHLPTAAILYAVYFLLVAKRAGRKTSPMFFVVSDVLNLFYFFTFYPRDK